MEGEVCVSMAVRNPVARNAEEVAFVSTASSDEVVRNVEAPIFAIMVIGNISARTAGELICVNMISLDLSVGCVVAVGCATMASTKAVAQYARVASMARSSIAAKNAWGASTASLNMIATFAQAVSTAR